MLLQSVFSALCTDGFTMMLLHEKLEDNKFPGSAEQHRTWHSSFVNFKQLVLPVQRAPLLSIDARSLDLYKYRKNFVCAELLTRAAAEMSAITLRPLWKCDPEEFYTGTNMKIVIVLLGISMSGGGMGCGGQEWVQWVLGHQSSTVALAGTVGTGAEGTGIAWHHSWVPESSEDHRDFSSQICI